MGHFYPWRVINWVYCVTNDEYVVAREPCNRIPTTKLPCHQWSDLGRMAYNNLNDIALG